MKLARSTSVANIAKVCRDFAAHPREVMRLLGGHVKMEWPCPAEQIMTILAKLVILLGGVWGTSRGWFTAHCLPILTD